MLKQKVSVALQHIFKKWDRFAFLLSLYGSCAFAMYTVTPTLLDPLLHNSLYGTRTYPLGLWILLFSVPVFILLYRSNVMKKNILKIDGLGLNRACFSFLSILIPTLIVLLNFLPELPHMWIFDRTILYGTSIAFASFLRNYSPDYRFAKDDKIHPEARIELIRMMYNSCYVALGILVAIGAGSLSLLTLEPKNVIDANEQILVSMAARIDLFYMLLGLVLAVAYPVFLNMHKAQQKLKRIKTHPN